MRRRTFQTDDTPTFTLTLRLIEGDSTLLSTVIIRWSSEGVGVEVPPGGLKCIGSFQDVFNFLVKYPCATREEVVTMLPRYGYVPEQQSS